ncbi:hypothetical protein [Nocardioides limicola]|uniref:hypothetical protein n=1 Tax=Nocardioides limicola TaxID=2803368 RepID=UPI00193B1AAA|nr:hypothetical protein [Nocardioides sp. DJM-14]
MANMWPSIVQLVAAAAKEIDVIVDLGRLHSVVPGFVAEAHRLLVVAAPTMEQVVWLREGVDRIRRQRTSPVAVTPVLVGHPKHAAAECGEVDQVLSGAGVHADLTQHLSWDPTGLQRLQVGGDPHHKSLAKSSLIKSARELAEHVSVDNSQHLDAASKWFRAGEQS